MSGIGDAFSRVHAATGSQERRRTLLIVAAEVASRMTLRLIFKDTYDIFISTDGPTAIDLIQNNEVDVVMVDTPMAGMADIDLLDRLRAVKPNLPVVIKTAFGATDTARLALNQRGCGYISIPFNLATIRSAVADAIQRRIQAERSNA